MARYVASEIQDQISQENAGRDIDLALVVEHSEHDLIVGRVEEYGGSINRVLPSGVLLVSVPGDRLREFLESEALESASSPERMEIQT